MIGRVLRITGIAWITIVSILMVNKVINTSAVFDDFFIYNWLAVGFFPGSIVLIIGILVGRRGV